MRFLYCVILIFISFAAKCADEPERAQIEELLAQEQFDQALAQLQSALDALPATQSRAAYLELGVDIVSEAPAAVDKARVSAWLDELEAIYRARGGDADPGLALPLALRADLSWRDKKMAEAEALSARSIEHLTDAASLSNATRIYALATAAHVQGLNGQYSAAVALSLRALAFSSDSGSALERLRRLRAMYFLSQFEERNGDGVAALADARAALHEAEQWLNKPTHASRMRLTSGVAELLIMQGDYAQALSLVQPTLEPLRQAGKPRDLAYALAHVAEAERHLGNAESALEHYREAVRVAETDASLVASGSFAAILGNLGSLEFESAQLAQADEHLRRSLSLQEIQFGKDNPRIAPALIDLGEVALARDQTDIAQARFERALAVIGSHDQQLPSHGAPALRGLAEVKLRSGQPALAKKLFVQALQMFEAGYGSEHPDLLQWRCQLALAEARNGELDTAFARASAVEQQRIELLTRVVPALPQAQGLELKQKLGGCAGLMLTLAAKRGDRNSVARAWSLVAAARGLATRLLAERLQSARQAADIGERQQWDAWSSAASEYASALGANGLERSARLKRARTGLDRAERQLGAQLAVANQYSKSNFSNLVNSRPASAALIAYSVAVQPNLDRNAGGGLQDGLRELFAFVADGKNPPRLLGLGDEAAADALVGHWYALARQPESSGAALAKAGNEIRAALWDPLKPGKAGRVLIVAVGALSRINYAALPDGDSYLVERGWRFHTLESEHDLQLLPSRNGSGLLLVGAPHFDTGARSALASRSLCAATASLAPLPGAARELGAIARTYSDNGGGQATQLSGDAATVAAVKEQISRYNIVHFATHAVELGDGCAAQPVLTQRGVSLSAASDAPAGTARSALENGSGLALTGAGGYADTGDGILLSAEVVSFRLQAVNWVVLSACDTGLGESYGDEGVFGLRRAFRLAGARTVVMSLWKVDDSATADWMGALYAARLHDHADTPDAVANAQLAQLTHRRSAGESTAPYYWAGFIASGDWR